MRAADSKTTLCESMLLIIMMAFIVMCDSVSSKGLFVCFKASRLFLIKLLMKRILQVSLPQ